MSDSAQSSRNERVGYRRAQRHIEAVASRLDECLRDQASSRQGWDGLASLWRSAERAMSNAENYFAWHGEGDTMREQEEHRIVIREDLLLVAARLLDLSSHIESMRRADQ